VLRLTEKWEAYSVFPGCGMSATKVRKLLRNDELHINGSNYFEVVPN